MYLTNENILGEKCWMGSGHQATDPDNPQWVAPSLCIKILNFIREGENHTRITKPPVLYFPKSTDKMLAPCLVWLYQRKPLTNPNDLAECQNTPATAYVRGSFCFEYWVPLTVRVTQACVRPK